MFSVDHIGKLNPKKQTVCVKWTGYKETTQEKICDISPHLIRSIPTKELKACLCHHPEDPTISAELAIRQKEQKFSEVLRLHTIDINKLKMEQEKQFQNGTQDSKKKKKKKKKRKRTPDPFPTLTTGMPCVKSMKIERDTETIVNDDFNFVRIEKMMNMLVAAVKFEE